LLSYVIKKKERTGYKFDSKFYLDLLSNIPSSKKYEVTDFHDVFEMREEIVQFWWNAARISL
jgi:hypothetical protein